MTDNQPLAEAAAPRARIEQVIGMLRPFIQSDGGDIEFVDFTPEGIVQVRLKGACVGCPGAVMTLRFGVEARLRECIPEVQGVECVA